MVSGAEASIRERLLFLPLQLWLQLESSGMLVTGTVAINVLLYTMYDPVAFWNFNESNST